MNGQGFDFRGIDLQEWVTTAWEFALPRLLGSVGWLAAVGVIYWLARWGLRRLERAAKARTATKLDDAGVALARRLVLLSLAFWLIWRLALTWELARAANMVIALWIVALSFPIGRFVGDLLELFERRVAPRTATTFDETTLPLINRIVRILIIILGVLIALEYLGINITPLLAGAGVAGLAISLAAKDTLSNLIAGVQLVLDRPFKVGDRVELWSAPQDNATWGDVVEIGLRATKIRTPDNLVVIVPNNEIMRRDIINYTASGDHIRLRVPIGVAYDSDMELAKKLILQAASETENVMSKPEPLVILRTFAESSVNLEARFWIENARDRRDVGDRFTQRVQELFAEHRVEIPYPKRDIYVHSVADGEEGSVPPGAAETEAAIRSVGGGTAGDPRG